MDFASVLKQELTHTTTENGCLANNTTGNRLLDLFSTIGALRDADKDRIIELFSEAYADNPLLAMKCLFYVRDIRQGQGERRVFRVILKWLANKYPESVKPNIPFIGFFGRLDDLYVLVDTTLEDAMWEYMKLLLDLDTEAMKKGKPCSLLAKWMYTPTRTNPERKAIGIKSIKALGFKNSKEFRKRITSLRSYLNIVEVKMSAKEWSEIDYEKVPARAALRYRECFNRNDNERYSEYISKLIEGKAKINSSTLYPYDIVGKYWDSLYYGNKIEDPILEEQWKALPNYVDGENSAIVIADVSGSMVGRPINSSIGLAIYFAQRNKGPFHNIYMEFSSNSRLLKISENVPLITNIRNVFHSEWGGTTNLEAAFEKILDLAVQYKVPANEMIKSLIVISDMEIDQCEMSGWSFYDEMSKRYEDKGYKIPSVVFWNVDSRNNVFHADASRKGVILVSGNSTTTFKNILNSTDKTPVAMMMEVLNDPRYDIITV